MPEKGIFKLEEFCDYGLVVTTNKLKIDKYKKKRKEKILADMDIRKAVKEESEKKRSSFFASMKLNNKKRKERDETVEEEKKREKKGRRMATPGTQRVEPCQLFASENKTNEKKIVKQQEGEMRLGQQQEEKKIILKGVNVENMISKFEADIQVPLHKAESCDWRKGSPSLANRGELQSKVENLGTGHQRVGR